MVLLRSDGSPVIHVGRFVYVDDTRSWAVTHVIRWG